MKLFRPSVVKEAAHETLRELDLLTEELKRVRKMLLNGHHDIQMDSEIKPERKPNGTTGTDH